MELLGVAQGHWDRPEGQGEGSGSLQDPSSPAEWPRALVWGFAASGHTAFLELTTTCSSECFT